MYSSTVVVGVSFLKAAENRRTRGPMDPPTDPPPHGTRGTYTRGRQTEPSTHRDVKGVGSNKRDPPAW